MSYEHLTCFRNTIFSGPDLRSITGFNSLLCIFTCKTFMHIGFTLFCAVCQQVLRYCSHAIRISQLHTLWITLCLYPSITLCLYPSITLCL